MAKKNESILNLLVVLPWWVSLLLAAILYIFLKTILPVISFDNWVFGAFAKAATGFAPLISFIYQVKTRRYQAARSAEKIW